MRNFAKFLLNSAWGFFAKSACPEQFKIVTTRQELLNLVNRHGYEILDHFCLTDDDEMLAVVYKDTNVKTNKKGGCHLALIITAMSRIKLLGAIEAVIDALGHHSPIYCDTVRISL